MMKHMLIKVVIITSLTITTNANAIWSIESLGGIDVSYAINNSGVIVGTTGDGTLALSVLFDPAVGNNVNLGTGWAFDINDSGQAVVTESYPGPFSPTTNSYIADSSGAILTNLPGTIATTINNSGQVAGWAIHSGQTQGFYSGPNGIGITYLGSLGGSLSYASGINDSGQVTGVSYIAGNAAFHAFITDPATSTMTDLGTLGGTNTFATDINNSGQVVGKSDTTNGEHAFVTGSDGAAMTDLGTMGADHSSAVSINNLGQVVGSAGFDNCTTSFDCSNTFVYSNGVMVNLTKLPEVIAAGWVFLHAEDINDKGQIVGYGVLNDTFQGFILSGADDENFFNSYVETPMIPPHISPIPEPNTHVMLLIGLGLIGVISLRMHLLANSLLTQQIPKT
jgi:probable HAF family extracellular repeat protein